MSARVVRVGVAAVVAGLALAGCGLTSPRQTVLRSDDQQLTVYVEGRGQLCAGFEDGTAGGQACGLEADVDQLEAAAMYGRDDEIVLVAVVPFRVAEVEILTQQRSTRHQPTASDIATALLVARVPRGSDELVLVLYDAEGAELQRTTLSELPDPGAVVNVTGLAQ